MAKKKLNILKDLKKMGLVPKKKAQDQMLVAGAVIFAIGIFILMIVGMIKYPVPHDLYYDGVNYPANHFGVSQYMDYNYCECGNDPLCWDIPEDLLPKPEEEKYRYYV